MKKKLESIKSVLMSGGSGTRLWPISRSSLPKQFLPLNSESSLLEQTIKRTSLLRPSKTIIVCNEKIKYLVERELKDSELPTDIVVEPFQRNTAPAITIAAMIAKEGLISWLRFHKLFCKLRTKYYKKFFGIR